MDCFSRLFGSKGKDGGSNLFKKGVKVAEEGRFALSETIFNELLQTHPAHAFWVRLHSRIREVECCEKSGPLHDVTNGSGIVPTSAAEGNINDIQEYIELSLSAEVIQVLDFIRLCMDIAHSYLNQPANEVNGRLAMAHCALIVVYLFEFFHLLMIWRRTVGEELMKQLKETPSGEKFWATPLDILCVFRAFKHSLVYYFVNAALSYVVLSLQYLHHLESPSDRTKQRIVANCLELSNLVHYIVKWVASSMPDSPTAQFLLEQMPGVEFELYLDASEESSEAETKSEGAVTKKGHSCSYLPSSSVGGGWETIVDSVSQNKDFGLFFFHLRAINPELRIVRELPKYFPLRLFIETRIPRHLLPNVENPTARNCFHYSSWFFAEEVTMLPGQSLHYLARELPEMFGSYDKGFINHNHEEGTSTHTSLQVHPKVRDTSAVFFKYAHDLRPITGFETDQTACRRNICARTAAMIKRRLNMSQFDVLAAVGLEELMLTSAPMLIVTEYLLDEVGRSERAREFDEMFKKNVGLMYGTHSFEYDFFTSMNYLCSVKL